MKFVPCFAFAWAIALSAPVGAKDKASHFRSGDLVVMGVARSRSYDALDDFGMSSMITADLRVTRVIRGRAPSPNLTIRYIAHMDLPADSALQFHLRRARNGTWLVCKLRGGQGYICN